MDELDRLSLELITRNNLNDGYIRSIVFASAERIMVCTRDAVHHQRLNRAYPNLPSPIQLTVSKWCWPAPHTAPVHSKGVGNYVLGILTKNEAEQKDFADSLLLTYDGRLAEATSANVFLVKDGQLHTPIPDCFLSGITRKIVIDLARQIGVDTEERHIQPEEIETVDEVFLTGTA